ncbi:uncharacterized protein LOC117106574 [Anneissia japonica]|uniref:uncharacterized protein LOC117106574 n=1 Tax=Anneissia japonica TaxID=1529436 RepID=UPI0014258AAD|nr:uncharacterized protein LOC117106574 [Anneissia japonica]XP_033103850.1 uncharacterized protein LOC117106574 [Anneissia japonica]XP_033103851.1 uncharacterized protein LOC117106574 [Anneissia japonica]
MASEISVAISDGVLTLSALGPAVLLGPSNKYASAGFLLVATAAFLGVFRFGQSQAGHNLIYYHKLFTWLSTILGMNLLASGFYYANNHSTIASIHLVLAVVFTLGSLRTLNVIDEQRAETVASTTAVLSFLFGSLLLRNPFGVLGMLLYAVSGAVGTTGELMQVKRVNWFHYIFAFGTLTLLKAFQY